MATEVNPTRKAPDDALDWKICGILLTAAMLASLAVLPYLIEISRATGEEVAVWEFTVSTVTEHMVLAAIAVCVGLKLGRKVDLGTPLLEDWLSGNGVSIQQAWSALAAALVGGIAVAVALSIADPWLEALMPEWPETAQEAQTVADNMAAWKPLLASFSAGVTEEILFRYCLMTLFVWLGLKATSRTTTEASLFWLANLLAALLFSLAHLANVIELGISITAGLVLYVVIWNGIASFVFGWLYWRRGLEAAILAHIVADIVVKVVVPLLE